MKITGITVTGDTGHEYKVYAAPSGAIYCTCPAYQFQSLPAMQRTCKHIEFVVKKMR